MPSLLNVRSDGIYRSNDRTNSEELVSNFTVSLLGLVEDAGGPGFLAQLKRFPDETEK